MTFETMGAFDRLGRRFMATLGLLLALVAPDAAAIVAVIQPWVRLSPDARSAEAYLQLRSSEDAKLVGATSTAARNTALRNPRPTRVSVPEITLPAREMVALAPGTQRVVLASLTRPLKLGDRVAIVLTVMAADGRRQEIPVDAEVRRHSPSEDHRHARNTPVQ
jgi:periplasmic copper chaperone A